MNLIRTAVCSLALPILLGPMAAHADDRGDAERACRDRIAAQGHRDARIDQTRYDVRGPGATLTGVVRSGADDRHRFECQLDRSGRVRAVSLSRIDGGDRRPDGGDRADGRRDAERDCRDRLASDGRRDPRLEQTRYDARGSGATLTGVVRSGQDDRHRFECQLDRNGRVRSISLARIGGDGRPEPDRGGDRRGAENACRDRIAADGRADPKLDQTRYDAKGAGATLTGVVRSGQDDRHRFECQLDRNGRVRGVSLSRIGGNDREPDRDRGQDNSRAYGSLVGAHIGDAQSQLQAMGFERKSGDNWFLGATGECITVRLSGGRVADVRRTDDRNCR